MLSCHKIKSELLLARSIPCAERGSAEDAAASDVVAVGSARRAQLLLKHLNIAFAKNMFFCILINKMGKNAIQRESKMGL